MTTYFYGRNSDIESFDRGSSIDTQLSKAISYANIKDLKIDEHLMITYEWSDWRNGLFLWIQSVYVSPGARGSMARTLC